MRSHHYDALRLFVAVAHHNSLSAAAEHLHLTKGALSHQIKRLEDALGFNVFERHAKGITLSAKGGELFEVALLSFKQLDNAIEKITNDISQTLTIGVSTYFASRWLSPRLTGFMQAHPDIRLRIQPMIDLLNFAGEEVDLSIRWGHGQWFDCKIIPLMNYPAWPTGNKHAYELVNKEGIEAALSKLTLLRDREDSNAWSEWYKLAGLTLEKRSDALIIPDPNVRVQAVLDGQGIALNDALVRAEIESHKLYRLSDVELSNYGYHLACTSSAADNPVVELFIEWIAKAVKDSHETSEGDDY